MSNAQEYITLYDAHKELIEKPCATLLNEARHAAIEKFRNSGFPTTKEEDWLHTDVAAQFCGSNYGMNLGRISLSADLHEIFTCDVPNLHTHRAFIVNDSFQAADKENKLPQGVLFGSLNRIAHSHKELIAPYYNKLAADCDSIAQFNTAFVQDGILLYIPANTEIEGTIQIVSLIQSKVDMMSNRRLLIILEKGAKASLLICDHSSTAKKTISTQVSEVFIGQGASLDIYELEETGNSNSRVGHLLVSQAADSRFNHCNITLTNGFTRNRINVALNGSGADTNITGLVIGDRKQHIDNRTLVEHKAGHCNSNELYKYILDEEAVGIFAGKMLIHPDAQQTTSEQTNRNLCLTSCARMYAQPQLEIYADDVKCSHGSTVGQLDENALFYMQQRGIPADEARHLLMYAFAGEVIENIKIEALRDRLHLLVEKRFRGELNHCKGCSLCK